MDKQNFVYVDANYLKELEETAKKVDYYKGIIDGIMMCREEPQTHDIRTNTHECVRDTHDKTEPSNSEKPNNCDCAWKYQRHSRGRANKYLIPKHMTIFLSILLFGVTTTPALCIA